MEIFMEAADGCKMPPSSYVAVRLADTLKQGRYDPSRAYHFPSFKEKRRQAKIDVFRLVGSSAVLISADEVQRISEVSVSSSDPNVNDLRLKVTAKPAPVKKAGTALAGPVKAVARKQAEDYLEKHGIQEKISSAMQQLLAHQPDDPISFLCNCLQGLPQTSKPATVPLRSVVTGTGASTARSALTSGPFRSYYSKHVLPVLPAPWCAKMYQAFPRRGPEPLPNQGGLNYTASKVPCMMPIATPNVTSLAAVEMRFLALARAEKLDPKERPFVSTVSEDALDIVFLAEAMLIGRGMQNMTSQEIAAGKEMAKAAVRQSMGVRFSIGEASGSVDDIRQAAAAVLWTANENGSLRQVINELQVERSSQQASSWNQRPSVATWLSNRPARLKPTSKSGTASFNLMPSVGTWVIPRACSKETR